MAGSSRLLAGVAFVVSLGLAGGAAYALDQATSKKPAPSALTEPSATPAPEQTPSPTPSPTPSATASPTPSPTPSATPSPTRSATPQPTVTRSPAATRYPYPRPTTTYQGLALSAGVNPQTGSVGSVFTLSGHATDGDGTIYVVGVDWEGNGVFTGGEADPTSCRSYPSPSTKPAPYSPTPGNRTFTRKHTYSQAGVYTVTVRVRSVNADCRPNGPKAEVQQVTFNGDGSIVVSQ
jgi:hypothetical protein